MYQLWPTQPLVRLDGHSSPTQGVIHHAFIKICRSASVDFLYKSSITRRAVFADLAGPMIFMLLPNNQRYIQ